MTAPEVKLSESQIKKRDQRYALLDDLVRDEHIAFVVNPKTRGRAIKDHADRTGVHFSKLYRLLTRYFWFGADRSALVSRDSAKGAKGRPRIGGKIKKGVRNSDTLLHGPCKRSGVNVQPEDLVLFEKALDEFWIRRDLSLRQTYDEMDSNYYVIKSRSGKARKIDPARVPTWDQFYYRARKIIESMGLWEKKYGDLDWSQYHRSRRGSATDICLGPSDIYDMDGADLKCELVTEDDRREACGHISAILVVDRGSSYVAGYQEYIGAEAWEYYRLALFWALTGARRRYDAMTTDYVSPFDPVFGPCNRIYVDRGPARGDAALDAVVSKLSIGRLIAPTERGDMKPVVESIVGLFQKEVAKREGGYTRRSGRRAKRRAKIASQHAKANKRELLTSLDAAIDEHNHFHDASGYLTKPMIDDGVRPVPAEIFKWGLANIQGRREHPLSERDIFLRLMPSKQCRLTDRGVRHDKADFSSEILRRYADRTHGRRNRSIEVFWSGVDPSRRYWIAPSGELDVLTMKPADLRKYNGMSVEERRRYLLHELSAKREINHAKRKRGLLTRKQERTLRTVAGVKQSASSARLSKGKNRELEKMHVQERLRDVSRSILEPAFKRPGNPGEQSDPNPPAEPRDSAARTVFNEMLRRRSK